MKKTTPDIDTEQLEPGRRRVHPQRLAAAQRGMVASQHWLATAAGVEMLKAGGNAMDAAVATAFALGVVEPAACGLGGQTFMLIHDAESGRQIALDGSSRAPHRIVPGVLPKAERFHGHRASTVPSTPAVLAWALARYGNLSLAQVLQPSIRLAEQGFPVSQLMHDLTQREIKSLRAGTAAPLFLKNAKTPYRVGQTFKQPMLGKTLRRLAEVGVEDFYQGDIARAIAADMTAHDGLIQLDDLAQIPYPVEREPLTTEFRGQRVVTFAEPGAGRVLISMLNVLEQLPDELLDPDTPNGALLLAQLIRQANSDRRDQPFDRDQHPQSDIDPMTELDYAQHVAERIRGELSSPRLSDDETRGDTTHLSVMDGQGNAVALTQSIERVYGSCAASPELGFIYNNYMSAFEVGDITHPYYLRPNAVPWASVAPTLVYRDDSPWLAIGSPGSARIVSAVAQVLLRLIVKGERPFDAVDAPRLHCSTRGKVSLEAPRMRSDLARLLADYGLRLDDRGPYAFYLGCVQLAMRQAGDQSGELIGVADPRRDGAAGGF